MTGYRAAHRDVLEETIGRLPADEALDVLVDMTHLRWLLLRPASEWLVPEARERLLALGGVRVVLERYGWTLAAVDRAPRDAAWFDLIASGGAPSRPVVLRRLDERRPRPEGVAAPAFVRRDAVHPGAHSIRLSPEAIARDGRS